MAPVGQTASQSVHQSHSTVPIMVIVLLTIARALQWHTPTHNPHPSHFLVSIIGISATFFSLHVDYFKSKGRHLSVIFVSKRNLHYLLESFFIRNYYAMAIQLDRPFLF